MHKTSDGKPIRAGQKVWLYQGMMEGMLAAKIRKVFPKGKDKEFVFSFRYVGSKKDEKARPKQLPSVFGTKKAAEQFMEEVWS